MLSVLTLSNQGIQTQTQELIGKPEHQSDNRIETGKNFLHHTIASYIQRINTALADVCLDGELKETIVKGQWKALLSKVATVYRNTDIDFMVVFDSE